MPLTFLKNVDGKFRNVSSIQVSMINPGGGIHCCRRLSAYRPTDYIVGNAGLNTIYQASDQYPVYITARDFDNNGGYEAIPSCSFRMKKDK
jgi:hypothetical protein